MSALKIKASKIDEEKTKVMCESFGTGTTQVVGNVKHPCSVCLKGVGMNSIRCTQCIQWVHARCSRVKDSLKKVESSFICRRCKGELCETRHVNSQDIAEVMRGNRLRWFGHVERRDELCWIKRIETLQVDGDGVKGRPRKRWREVLREDMREKGLCREDAWDRSRWRRMLWEGHRRG